MLMPTDIVVLQRFQEKHLLKTLSGDGLNVLPDHQMASNAITRLIQTVERQQLLLDNRGAKCWLYSDENNRPVFSISHPGADKLWKKCHNALALFVQERHLMPDQAPIPCAWMYLEDGKEIFTLDRALAAGKRYGSLPAVPLYQTIFAYDISLTEGMLV